MSYMKTSEGVERPKEIDIEAKKRRGEKERRDQARKGVI